MPAQPPSFDNRFANELPADWDVSNHVRQVHKACYSRVKPTRVSQPSLLIHSDDLAKQLGVSDWFIDADWVARVLSGNQLLDGMDPYAMCYGGHQFGHWAGQLGDGRAINLGQILAPDGQHWTLQLKGAGPTPYSRQADGLAVLRSSLREYVCSEAMHYLGIPTTRALSLVLTGDTVVRDMFYDGHPEAEPGAITCRVSPSFIRFGSFEIFASRGDNDTLKQLVAFCIRTDYPHLAEKLEQDFAEAVVAWFGEIAERTASLMVHWMRVGFVHGVMNTDNMSITGLTIDYGPYGWLEDPQPDWTPNTTDAQGRRYAYGNQPAIGQWNLWKLANALVPLVPEQTDALEQSLGDYASHYNQGWLAMMASKLGLAEVHEGDQDLITSLEELLAQHHLDWTLFFRTLPEQVEMSESARLEHWGSMSYRLLETADDLTGWWQRYVQRLTLDGQTQDQRRKSMNKVNPLYVPRNYLAQQAIDLAGQGDTSELELMMQVLRNPYDEQPGMERFAAKRPEWAEHKPGCSMLSCSS